jgi:two-component system, OmpR family, response regulator
MPERQRILVVEDDRSQAEPFKEMLEYRGYNVTCKADAPTALEAAQGMDPHLVIVDLLLVSLIESGNGFEIISALRTRCDPDLGIIAWTSQFVNAQDEIRALRAGADDYVKKDADFGVIEARIEALTRRVLRARQLRMPTNESPLSS